MAVRTRQTYMDLCRSDRPWRGREMEDLVDKIYDVEDKVERRSKEQQKAMTAAGASFNPDGEGYLQKREGKWVFGEPDFLTKPVADVLYAPRDHIHPYRPHAPFHHWNGGDALAGQQIAELRTIDRPTWAAVRLDPDAPAPPTRRTGDMFWDADNHCPSFVLEGSDTIWQGPMEDLLYGQNDSGVAHGNGLVGYISGSQGQRPTIDISRADDRTKSLAVVFATEAEIASNNSGYYTSRGFVRDVNTNGMAQGARLWLQPTGGYGTGQPSVGANVRNVMLGHVVRSHAVTGSLFADITPYPFIDELSGVSIVAPTTGQVLAFNGTIWENATIGSGGAPIENHNDLSGRTAANCHNAMAITDFYALATGQLTKRDGSGMVAAIPNTDYLAVNNPTYTGRLTGPTQHLETDEQILLAIRRTGGVSGRIHGISFMAQNDASAWVEFGRVMTYISSVAAGAHSGGTRLMAFKDGAIVQALDAGPTSVSVGAGLVLQMNATTVIDSSRNASFVGLAATGSPVFGATSGGSRGVTIKSQSGTVSGVNLNDGDITRVSLQLYASNTLRFVARNTSGVEIDSPLSVDLAAGGVVTIGGTARTTNFKGAIQVGATTVIDSNRNVTGATFKGGNLTGTGNRPLVAGADGTIDDQDAATFLGTIGAAASSHTHPYLPINNPNFTGILNQGGEQRIAIDGSGWFNFVRSSSLVGSTIRPVVVRPDGFFVDQDAGTFLTTIGAAPDIHSHSWSSITSKPTTFSGLGVTMLASDIPNHASRHHWDGADPLVGQSIAGLRTTSSPTFYNLNISEGIYFSSNSNSISTSLSDTIFRTDGTVRFRISPSEIRATVQFRAPFGGFDNLSGGGNVRADSSGQLVVGGLLESELPNHAPRHHWDGADPLTGQSISGLRTTDSPSFANLSLSQRLKFSGFWMGQETATKFCITNSVLSEQICIEDGVETTIHMALCPADDGYEFGVDTRRWNIHANDEDHDVEIVNATEGSAGTNIAAIPAIGNYFRLSAPTAGGYKNYRVPNNISGIGKELVITATSTDPNGFLRVYAPNSGSLFVEGASVPYIDFVWGRKLVLHSDGVRWYV